MREFDPVGFDPDRAGGGRLRGVDHRLPGPGVYSRDGHALVHRQRFQICPALDFDQVAVARRINGRLDRAAWGHEESGRLRRRGAQGQEAGVCSQNQAADESAAKKPSRQGRPGWK